MHEFEFVNWLRTLLDRPGGRAAVPVGIGDDMAVLRSGAETLLLGSDLTMEGIHFTFPEATPEQVGHKALGRCLSDCAAMAGVPVAVIVSVAKPKDLAPDMLKGVFLGLSQLADRFGCPIVGGDTARSTDGLMIDVCLLGKCEGNEPVLRSGAKVGDTLYVTGPLGGSILGRHLSFEPRIEQARWLVRHLPVHAMIDISDGLSSDLGHLCEASGCGAELTATALEAAISPKARTLAARTGKAPLDHALNDGEDFELLVALGVPPERVPVVPAPWRLIPIGRVTHDRDVVLGHPDGRRERLVPRGFRHF